LNQLAVGTIKGRKFAERVGLILCLVGIAVPFGLVLHEAAISIPCSDDYARAGLGATAGVLHAIRQDYFGWSGRFLSVTIEYALTCFIRIRWAYPTFVAVIWLFAVTLVYAAVRALFHASRRQALLLATAFEAIWLCTATDPRESLFWLTGEIEYLFSISVILCLIAIVSRLRAERRTPSRLGIAALALSAFAAAGFHELHAMFLVASLALLTGAVWRRDRTVRAWCLIVLGAAVLGLLVVVLAPGNAARLSVEPKNFDRLAAVLAAAEDVAPQIATFHDAAIVLAGATLFAARSNLDVRASVASLIDPKWVALFATVCIVLMFGAVVSIMSVIEARTVDGLLYLGLAACFLCLGLLMAPDGPLPRSSRVPQPACALVSGLFCLSLLSAPNTANLFYDAIFVSRSFRHEYSARLKLLRAASSHPGAHVTFARFDPMPRSTLSGDISSDPSNPDNKDLAGYYGLADVALGDANRLRFDPETNAGSK